MKDMAVSQKRIEARGQKTQQREDTAPSDVRLILEVTQTWAGCDLKACRRTRRCADWRRCERVHAQTIQAWRQQVIVPYLRERYPSVQWGAPASIMDVQIEAAQEVEKGLSKDEKFEKAREAFDRVEARVRAEAEGAKAPSHDARTATDSRERRAHTP